MLAKLEFYPVVFDPLDPPDTRRQSMVMLSDGFQFAFKTYLNWDNVELFDGVLRWCREHYGETCKGYPNKDSWFVHDTTIWFVNPDHAMEFKLRWV